MENPAEDVTGVIRSLCQGSRAQQEAAIQNYFLPNASFVHPFCYVPSYSNVSLPFAPVIDSRQLVLAIYRWYRTLSPCIEFHIDSCAFDDRSSILYVNMTQVFAIWFIPFYKTHVRLITVLSLVPSSRNTDGNSATNGKFDKDDDKVCYYISKQEDHYQVNEFVKFVLPGVGPLFCLIWQLACTFVCAVALFIADCAALAF